MPDIPGIDLRGRMMIHNPWSKNPGKGFPQPAELIINIVTAFRNEEGDIDELTELLNRHIPEASARISTETLANQQNHYSLEFYFYVVQFTKLLLQDICFRYTIDEETQLGIAHYIIEKGPMEYPPWIVDDGGKCEGYLSMLNLAAMFHYVEERYPVSDKDGRRDYDFGRRLSDETLNYLNNCTTAKYRVDRTFIDNEGILISFEYLFYGAAIFTCLTNNKFLTRHAHYYGYLHFNQLARAIFLQPDISPVNGFQEWQIRTNNVHRMEFISRNRVLYVKLHLRRQIQTGMFNLYEANTLDGIKQAAPAVYEAFLELATNKKVKTRIIQDKNEKYNFIVKIRWRPPDSSTVTYIAAGIITVAVFIAAVYSHLFISPEVWVFLIAAISAIAVGSTAGILLNWHNRLKRVKEQFRQSKDVINRQLDALKKTSNELLDERDVLDRKVRERTAELNEALEQLKQLDRSKTNFIANVSHELRTPLTLLSVPLEAISQGRYGSSVPADHPFFGMAARNVNKLKNQINQLLDLTRLDLGTMTFNPGKIELVSYCRMLKTELESLAAEKGLYLKMDNLSGRERIFITADQNMLETLLLNLLNNAFKFTDTGGISLELSSDNGDSGCGEITLSVKDTGIGFEQEKAESFFQRFTQAEGDEQRRKGGAGIGLALVKEIAIHHGWRIKAESSPGIGSSFSVVIKEELESADELSVDDLAFSKRRVVQEQLESEHFHKVHKPDKVFDNKRDTILLVEDNYDMGILLQNLLGEEYNLHWCSGGREALDWIKRQPQLSLIICDVMMPNMSGFNFRKHLQNEKDYSKLPFIFLTALADQRDRTEGLASGAVDYIRKPFNPAELLFKIQNLLETNKASYLQAVRDREAAERLSRNTAVIPPKKENPDWQDLGITAAERKIVEYVRIGLQDKEIASELSLSPRTVSSHLSHLYQKTGTQNRVELINMLYK